MQNRRRTPWLRRVRGIALAGLAAAACAEDPLQTISPPPPPSGPVAREEIPGDYAATTLLSITNAGADTTDVLAVGGSLTLGFESSGQLSGRVVAPGQGPGGGDVDADMSGIWSFNPVARTVTLTQGSDTFVEEGIYRPERTEDGMAVVLSASIPADNIAGRPAFEIVLER